MTTPTTLDRITKLLWEELDVPADLVKPETPLIDLGLDSLDKVSFVMAAEEDFTVDIPDAEAEGVQTVGDMVSLVDRLVATSVRHR